MINKSHDKTTIKDLAHYANVSVMTVSRYFNTPEKVSVKTRRRIKKAIKEMDYHPNEIARSLVTNKTFTIGVILPDIRNPYFSTLFHSIEVYTKTQKYHLLLCNTQESEEEEDKYITMLLSRKVDGFI